MSLNGFVRQTNSGRSSLHGMTETLVFANRFSGGALLGGSPCRFAIFFCYL